MGVKALVKGVDFPRGSRILLRPIFYVRLDDKTARWYHVTVSGHEEACGSVLADLVISVGKGSLEPFL